MSPHWPPPLATWLIIAWIIGVIVGTAVNLYGNRIRRAEERQLEKDHPEAFVFDFTKNEVFTKNEIRLPARTGVNAMFDPGKETRP